MLSSASFNSALQASAEESSSKEKNMASMAKRTKSKQDNLKGGHGNFLSLFFSIYNGGHLSIGVGPACFDGGDVDLHTD